MSRKHENMSKKMQIHKNKEGAGGGLRSPDFRNTRLINY